MAENDRTRGHRDNEIYKRPRAQSSDSSGDPLAELARLIGQQNESTGAYPPRGDAAHGGQPGFDQGWQAPGSRAPQSAPPQSPLRRASSQPAEPEQRFYSGDQYDPRYGSPAPQADRSYGGFAQPHDDPRQPGGSYADDQYADPRYANQAYPNKPYYEAGEHDAPGHVDPRYPDSGYPDQRYGDPRYGTSDYDESGAQSFADPRYSDPRYTEPRYADPRYAEPHYAEPNFGSQSHGAQSYPPSDGYEPAAGNYAGYGRQGGGEPQGQSYGNSYYGAPPLPGAMPPPAEDRRSAKRRGSMVTVLAVLAFAVVGTAAAFGYRAVFVGTGSPVPPPVIKADTQPSKVVPAADPNNKPIQDRIGVRTEKIVPRQEEPLQQAAPGQRAIAPFLAGQNPQAFPPASANIAPSGGAGSPQSQPSAEPKRVRTVPIKPQGAEAPAAPGPRSSRHAEPDAHVADGGNAPMALSPTGSVPTTSRNAARQAHAALTPNEPPANGSPFPTPLPSSSAPSASRSAVSGPFAVQVTSQRSESDAQASFRSLQQQFPSVLGSRQPVIRRADLGERGTYYRAQIPFASQNEASEFCSSLKAAGGQCVVARN
jgi:hypothetical protein